MSDLSLFKNCPMPTIAHNNRPLGENSSNLVTLIWRHHFFPTGFGHFHLGS
jgi:hypothetical protein